MFVLRSGSKLNTLRSSFSFTPKSFSFSRRFNSRWYCSENNSSELAKYGTKQQYSSYDGKLFQRSHVQERKTKDIGEPHLQKMKFGEDLGPKLDPSTKLKNQQRVIDKIQISYRSVRWAIAGNIIITVTKFTAAGLTGSSVLLSEAIHTYERFRFLFSFSHKEINKSM